jgi:Spy/CpxP family protein refolding chaperone
MKAIIASTGMAAIFLSFVAIAPALSAPTVGLSENGVGVGVSTASTAVVDVQQKRKPFLSDEQIESFKNLKDKYSVDNATKKAEIGVLRHQLFNELSKSTVDRSAVLALQGKINSLRDDLGNNKANYLVDSASLLTPEQRAEAHHRMLHFGFHKHHGGGRHEGGGPRGSEHRGHGGQEGAHGA